MPNRSHTEPATAWRGAGRGELLITLDDLPNNLDTQALTLETVASKGKIQNCAAPGQSRHLRLARISLHLWLTSTAGTREPATTPSGQNRV
ncbi:hypothetical protein B0H10DRAFT_2220386 [Mycena sp. CBHHK59/15]|nr:hypothetical protein B0H10DRAFT_2220386 [Mycena sp. CBHHK59/15]